LEVNLQKLFSRIWEKAYLSTPAGLNPEKWEKIYFGSTFGFLPVKIFSSLFCKQGQHFKLWESRAIRIDGPGRGCTRSLRMFPFLAPRRDLPLAIEKIHEI
jgi:hypothetical protein